MTTVDRGSQRAFARLRNQWCPDCRKFWFRSRKDARKAARIQHGHERLNVYRCPVDNDRWHYGHHGTAARLADRRESAGNQ